jgi:ElaB/YqjD/DUF883 family membrane-anchored ribosome-binding protein
MTKKVEQKKNEIWNEITSLSGAARRKIMYAVDAIEDEFPSWGWIVVGIGTVAGLVLGCVIGWFLVGAI